MFLSDLIDKDDKDALFRTLPVIDVSWNWPNPYEDGNDALDYDGGPTSGFVKHEGRTIFFHWWTGDRTREFVLVTVTEEIMRQLRDRWQTKIITDLGTILATSPILGRCNW